MPSPTLGIGLAGLGQHGLRYARHLLAGDVRGAALRAVWTRDGAKARDFAAREGVHPAESLEDLANASDTELLVAVLPPSRHPEAIEAAARAGKAVLVEKPLAQGLDAATRACDAAASSGARAGVAHTLRFNATVRALADALPIIGRIHLASLDQRFEPTQRGWLDDPREGGLLLNTGCHGTDLLHYLTGARIASARARARSMVTRRCEDVFAAVLELEPGGILATLDNSRATGGRSGRIELVGEKGILRADHVHGALELVEGRRRRTLPQPDPVHTVSATLQAFVDALRKGEPMPISLEEGRRAVEGIEIIRASLATRADDEAQDE